MSYISSKKRPINGPRKTALEYPRRGMSEFKVSSDINKVEVYVHNRYEHFKRTISRMTISKQVKLTINTIKNNLKNKMRHRLNRVRVAELQYLSKIGIKDKKEYYREFSQYKDGATTEVMQLLYNFTDMSASNYAELERIYERRFNEEVELQKGEGVQNRRREALARIQKDIIQKNKKFMDNSEDYLKNLLTEHQNFQDGGDQATDEALNKRIEVMKTIWKSMSNSTSPPPPTLKKAITQAAKLRKGTDGLGVSFEPVAGLAFSSFNDFLNKKFNKDSFSGKRKLVGDSDRENQYTTDITVEVGEINIGIDIKSQSAIYLKSVQKQGYANEILSAMFLGEGGFAELKNFNSKEDLSFGSLAPSGGEELFKKLTYILVNSSVFEDEGGKLKGAQEAERALRSILIIGGFVDFIATYLSKAINDSRQQLLLFTGEKLIFTSDFIERLIQMVEKINVDKLDSLYGMNIEISDNEQSGIAEELKTKLLKNKLRVLRKDGIDTYEQLFRNPEIRESIKTITSKSLQRTMKINIKAPISTLFKGLGK